jgi:multidrug resistance efflux pump
MKGRFKYANTLVVVALALGAAYLLYHRYSVRPWTRDAQVRANVVGIAPRVYGPIVQIPIKDNQPVKKGDLLFEIDPATYRAAVDDASAKVQQTAAQTLQAHQNLARQEELYKTKVVDQQTYQNAQDQYDSARANEAAAKAQLQTAELNLRYTKVYAPVDGYLTNVRTSAGTYVNAGEELLALVDARSFWVAAYFKETQISNVKPGDKVKVTLMGYPRQPFEGVVESTGWAVLIQDGSTVKLIPQVAQTIDWVQLPQRFPVRVRITGQPPAPLRIGQTTSVAIRSQ